MNPKVGQLIETEEYRDAIHVAIAPMVANTALFPGQQVGITPQGKASGSVEPKTGIVDPFLEHRVLAGQRFWLFLFPNTVTSLRHEWTHPAFDGAPAMPPPPGQDIKDRLKEIAAECDIGYDMMMHAAEMWLDREDYTTQQGSETWRDSFPAYAQEFWELYEKLSGKPVPADKRISFFSCSC